MRHYDFFWHTCKRPFSETLTTAENEEGKVVWPHYYRTQRSSIIPQRPPLYGGSLWACIPLYLHCEGSTTLSPPSQRMSSTRCPVCIPVRESMGNRP